MEFRVLFNNGYATYVYNNRQPVMFLVNEDIKKGYRVMSPYIQIRP